MAFCTKCGKEITGSFCPNCGNPVNGTQGQAQPMYQAPPPVSPQKLNIMALVGFILGCASIFLNFWGIVGIVSLVFSVVGLVQISNGNGKGKGFAIAGIVIGGFSVLYGFITLLLLM